ncbi:hypothetical protein [Mycolicibacterium vulneris]|nr:hypothetical protein [Mycolicibacterium vulneris]
MRPPGSRRRLKQAARHPRTIASVLVLWSEDRPRPSSVIAAEGDAAL